MADQKTYKRKNKKEENLISKEQNIRTYIRVDNFEVGILTKSNNFHALVEQVINKLEQDKEKEKEELDSTDGVVATIKSSVEKNFFEKEIDDLDALEGDKIALRTLSKIASGKNQVNLENSSNCTIKKQSFVQVNRMELKTGCLHHGLVARILSMEE